MEILDAVRNSESFARERDSMSFTCSCSCSCSVTKTMRIVTSLWLIAATIWSLPRVRVCLFCWKGLKKILSRVLQVACNRYDMWDDLRTTSPDYVCGDMGEVLELREGLSWRRAFFLGLEVFFVRKTEALFQVKDWGVLPVQLLWGAREIHSRCSCRQNQFWGFRYLISSHHHQQGFGYSFSHAVLWWRSSRCPGLTIFFHQGT